MKVFARFGFTLLTVVVAGCGEGDMRLNQQAGIRADARQERPADADCVSQTGYEQLKAAAFSKARAIQERNAPALEALAAATVVRMDTPLVKGGDDALNVTLCKGRMVIDLPPGAVDVFSGNRRLVADVEYRTQAAADGQMRVYSAVGLDPIAYRIAAIVFSSGPGAAQPASIVRASSPPNAAPDATAAIWTVDPGANPPRPARQARAALVSYQRPAIAKAPARASFDCRNARTRGQQIVCADGYLASLDRETRFLYNRAVGRADRDTRAKLRDTGARFLARRERCKRWACVEDVYEDRIKQIERIASRD